MDGQASRQPNLLERPPDEGARLDLLGPVGAHEQDVTRARVEGEALEEPKRGRVGPLEVVQEEHERTLGGSEARGEGLEDEVEAVLGLRRPDLCRWRMLAQEALQTWHHVADDAGATPQHRARPAYPRLLDLRWLLQEPSGHALERLH